MKYIRYFFYSSSLTIFCFFLTANIALGMENPSLKDTPEEQLCMDEIKDNIKIINVTEQIKVAIKNGDCDTFKKLIDAHKIPSDFLIDNDTSLVHIMWHNTHNPEQMMQHLLDKGFDINQVSPITRISAIRYAFGTKNEHFRDWLITNGAQTHSPNDAPQEQLIDAIRHGDITKVEELINNNEVDLNSYSPLSKQTALIAAARCPFSEATTIAELLIKNGANVNKPSFYRTHTPLSAVIHDANNLAMATLLKQHNAHTDYLAKRAWNYLEDSQQKENFKKLLEINTEK